MRSALVGRDVKHSFSKELHEKAARLVGHPLHYDLLSLTEAELISRLPSLEKEFAFLNFTSPFKEWVQARFGGEHPAPNLVFNGRAFGTDGEGFELALNRLGFTPNDFSQVVCLGDGGVVRALEWQFRCSFHLKIARRRGNWRPEMIGFLPENCLLIQATSASDEELEEFARAIKKAPKAIVDLRYREAVVFREAAEGLGIPFQDGRSMLVEQALAAHRLVFGTCAEYDELTRELSFF